MCPMRILCVADIVYASAVRPLSSVAETLFAADTVLYVANSVFPRFLRTLLPSVNLV